MLALLVSIILFFLAWTVTFSVIGYYSGNRKDSYLYDEDPYLFPDFDESAIWENEPNEFIDDDGDHVYYDRAIIEKKIFHRKHPNIPLSSLRTLSSLLF